ncbi:MAG: hypothetical protein ACK4J0_01020 [Candidatus Anstonellaceae archaeon]
MEGRKKVKIKLIYLFLFVFFSLIYSQSSSSLSLLSGKYFNLALVGIAISISIASLAYMAGSLFDLPGPKAFAKEEISHLLFTALLIILIASGLILYQNFSASLATSNFFPPSKGGQQKIITGICEDALNIYNDKNRPETKLFTSLDWFLGCIPLLEKSGYSYNDIISKIKINQNTSASDLFKEFHRQSQSNPNVQPSYGILLSYLLDMYISLIAFEMVIGPVSTFGFSVYLPEYVLAGTDISLAPLSGLNLISESLIFLSNLVSFGLVNIIVQKITLKFIYVSMLTFVLPIGITFRCLPFLRKTGSSIIALALVAYFIYPISLWINEQIYLNAFFDGQKSLLINWANYETLLGSCLPKKDGETYEQYYDRIYKQATSIYSELEKEKEAAKKLEQYSYSTSDPRLPTSQQRGILSRFTGAVGTNMFDVLSYLVGYDPTLSQSPTLTIMSIITGIFTAPFRTEFFFKVLMDQYIVAGQWLVVNMFFLVNSIILCFTFYKNISEAIGGETKLFGIGRLL